LRVTLNIAIYDGLPLISKWFEIENRSCIKWTLNSFTLEELAVVERDSQLDDADFMLLNIHVESDYTFGGGTYKDANSTVHWIADKRYTSQVSWSLNTPCLPEVKPIRGPEDVLGCGGVFKSFRTWLMPLDSDDRERQGLALKRFYRTVAP
jgi:hypothetical protein